MVVNDLKLQYYVFKISDVKILASLEHVSRSQFLTYILVGIL